MRPASIRFRTTLSALILMAAPTLVCAQDQPASGGWRRVGEAPPASASAPAPAREAQNPMEPVDRGDQYGPAPQANPPADPQAAPPYSQQGGRPAYGLPAQLTLIPGTYVTVRINQPLSTDRNQPGDTFSASLIQPVVVDGVVVSQRGQTVYGRVAQVQKQHSGGVSRLGLELTSLTLADGTQEPIRSQLVNRQGGTTPAGAQAGTIAGTTAIGAAVGAAADWGTGAAIGGGVGAAAGIVGVLLTRNHPTVVYPETALTFQVSSPVTISTSRAPQAYRYVGPDDYDQPNQRPMMQSRPPVQAYGYGPSPYYYGYAPYYPYPYWGGGFGAYWGPSFYFGRGYYRRWR